jgi:hypothetical protein
MSGGEEGGVSFPAHAALREIEAAVAELASDGASGKKVGNPADLQYDTPTLDALGSGLWALGWAVLLCFGSVCAGTRWRRCSGEE